MAATLKAQVMRELARMMREKGAKAKDKLEAARLFQEISGKPAPAPPPVVPVAPVPKAAEPSSLD